MTIQDNAPVLHYPQCARLHAVDGPGGVPLRVADGDAEPAVVGPHQADARPRLALDVKDGPLAAVACPSLRPCKPKDMVVKKQKNSRQKKTLV